MHGGAPFGARFVRCRNPEASASPEVANVLQLWYFQSVTRQVSVVAWVSASRRVRYRRSTVAPKPTVLLGYATHIYTIYFAF